MARLVICLLLIPLASAISDPEGDVTQKFGGPPVDEPAVDLRNVTATLSDGELDMRLETWGELRIGQQANGSDPDRLYTYLFIVALGAKEDANVYDHIAQGEPGLTAVCTYSQGNLDLTCEVTMGEGVLRGASASGHNMSARFAIDHDGSFAIAGSSQVSVPNGTARDILAQDFTENALPYQGLPEDGEVVEPEAKKDTPWWKTGGFFALVAVGVIAALIAVEIIRSRR